MAFNSKRQFLRKISEWGFEKNVKRAERRLILLNAATQSTDIEGSVLRGRKLDKAKIDRWRKRDGLVVGQPHFDPSVFGFNQGKCLTSVRPSRSVRHHAPKL